jgi:hypothetical protein
MFHPVPRVDRWEPWIELALLGLIAVGIIVLRLL